MAFCNNCGNRLLDGAKFCTECGARVQARPEPVETEPMPVEPVYRQTEPVNPYGREYRDPYAKARTMDASARVILLATVAVLGVGILLLACLLMTKLFRNRTDTEDDILGRYESIACRYGDVDLGADGEWIELRSDGTAVLYLMDYEYTGKWELNGSALTVYQGNDTFSGTLTGDTIELTLEDYVFTYCKDGSSGITGSESHTALPENDPVDEPESEWYGWWIISEGTGEWEEYEGDFWDACALIEMNADGSANGNFLFWDEESEEDECISSVDFHFGDDGTAILDSGFFWDADLDQDIWYMDMDGALSGGITDMICVTGIYTDPENSDNTLTYCLYLRPWGERWDDLKGVESPDYPYEDMMPSLYEDWYLPLIEAGDPMPMVFDSENS